jgi:P4 family phage/plasmid primase-like protien
MYYINQNMMTSPVYTTFEDYLRQFKCNNTSNNNLSNFTHTRIPSKDLHVNGGSYFIPDDKINDFYEIYYDNVFINKKQEFLTEKQLIEDGPILIDLDLHYEPEIETRQHTKEHIIDLISLYFEKLGKLLNINDDAKIPAFIFEKPAVNMLENKTKDGIHLIIGIKCHKALQILLRDIIKQELPSMWDDLPVKNSWDTILDEGVTKGHCNWQLFGSRKPGNKAYELTGVYYGFYNNENEDWNIVEENIKHFDIKKNFKILSAQYKNHVYFNIREEYIEKYNETVNSLTNKSIRKVGNKKFTIKRAIDNNEVIEDNEIKNIEQLDKKIQDMFDNIQPVEYELKETYGYTMILPETYYGPGSYDKWIRVGWALKNTSDKMFLTWLKLSSKSSEFTFDQVPELYEKWLSFEYKNKFGLTRRSIMYWAKNSCSNDIYESVRRDTIDYFITESIKTLTEFDFATVLYNIFKDQFVCASIKSQLWYQYKGHKWEEIDSGSTLRLLISKDMHDIYCKKSSEVLEQLEILDQSDKRYEDVKKQTNKLAEICVFLKKTAWKNNIMREAQELFYDKDFINKLDQNPYLLCFNNGVIDFENKLFRKGQPDDYISMSTNNDYIPYSIVLSKYSNTLHQIDEFMNQLFPDPELRRYMWDHLASCLIGTNENQTFNIYTGSGANGKSKLVDLLSKCLGDYKGTVPLTLITQKRNNIGSTSSEIVELKGKRLAVMQEPSKGDTINEGIMKEITGGDPIQGRALFKDVITFVPQFKLVVTTNTLFDIRSNDDGTWRRIRLCDFMSKFVEQPYSDEIKFPRNHYPYQYRIDKKLDSKFNDWAPIFVSKLVDIGFRTKGNVIDCKHVLMASDMYRDGQDYLSEFSRDKIKRVQGKNIKKTEVMETFKQWYIINYGRNIPKAKELYDFMDKRYGMYKTGGWINVAIIYDDEEDENQEQNIEA